MGIDLFIPIQAMQGYQELCKRWDWRRERPKALEGSQWHQAMPTNTLRSPAPKSWQSEEGTNPSPCAKGVLEVGIPCWGSSAGCPWCSLTGGEGWERRRRRLRAGGCRAWPLQRERGPFSLSARLPHRSQLLLPPLPIKSPAWVALSEAGAALRRWALR